MSVLSRVRLITLVFAVLVSLSVAVQFDTSQSTARVVLAGLALLAIIMTMSLTYALRRIVVSDPLLPLLAVVTGATMLDPRGGAGLCVGILASQSLYGSTRMTVLRLSLLLPVVPLTVYANPGADFGWNDPSVLSLMPGFVIFTLLIRVLKSSLEWQAETSARDALLALTSRSLLGCTDMDKIHEIMVNSAAALIDLSPGLVMITLARDGLRARVLRVHGGPVEWVGMSMPFGQAQAADKVTVDELLGGSRRWRSVELDRDMIGQSDGELLLLGRDRQISESLLDAVRMLGAQVSMAKTACRAHAELQHRAHHDELTAIPNRAVLFDQLTRAVEASHANGSSAAVMVIDLDDFKSVNDTFGHGAGDTLLVEMAGRMAEVVGDAGIAARFGGDEFAVLLPRTSHEQATRLGDQLLARLLEPVQLAQAAVTVGCSIGLAFTADGRTATDLLRCADVAMYAAKAGGKNRVEDFAEDRHGRIAHDPAVGQQA